MTEFKNIQRHTFKPENQISDYNNEQSPETTFTQTNESLNSYSKSFNKSILYPCQRKSLKDYIQSLTNCSQSILKKGELPKFFVNSPKDAILIDKPFLFPLFLNTAFVQNQILVNYGYEIKEIQRKQIIASNIICLNMMALQDNILLSFPFSLEIQSLTNQIIRKYESIGPILSVNEMEYMNSNTNKSILYDFRTIKPVLQINHEQIMKTEIKNDYILFDQYLFDRRKEQFIKNNYQNMDLHIRLDGGVYYKNKLIDHLDQQFQGVIKNDDNRFLLIGDGQIINYELEDLNWKKILQYKHKQIISEKI